MWFCGDVGHKAVSTWTEPPSQLQQSCGSKVSISAFKDHGGQGSVSQLQQSWFKGQWNSFSTIMGIKGQLNGSRHHVGQRSIYQVPPSCETKVSVTVPTIIRVKGQCKSSNHHGSKVSETVFQPSCGSKVSVAFPPSCGSKVNKVMLHYWATSPVEVSRFPSGIIMRYPPSPSPPHPLSLFPEVQRAQGYTQLPSFRLTSLLIIFASCGFTISSLD